MEGAIFATRSEHIEYIKFIGTVRYSHCAGLESHINHLFETNDFERVVIDLENAEILDSTALGLLARIAIEQKKSSELKPVIFVKEGELHKILKRVCFDHVFELVLDKNIEIENSFVELAHNHQNENQVLKRVIDAHRHLAQLDKKNEQLYQDITRVLGS